MMFPKALSVLAALSSIASASPFWPISPRQGTNNVCLPGFGTTYVYISTQIIYYQVEIDTFVQDSTVFNINNGITIQGPTSISTVIQATTTVEVTTTVSTTT